MADPHTPGLSTTPGTATPSPPGSAAPLPAHVVADPVALTRALVDIESVSGNERQIADRVEEVLRGAGHLRVERLGHTVMARTDLGRERRVILAGHLDTVPVAGNLPARVDAEAIHGCGTGHEVRGAGAAPGGGGSGSATT